MLARLHALGEAEAELATHAAALERAEGELRARATAAEQHRRRAGPRAAGGPCVALDRICAARTFGAPAPCRAAAGRRVAGASSQGQWALPACRRPKDPRAAALES